MAQAPVMVSKHMLLVGAAKRLCQRRQTLPSFTKHSMPPSVVHTVRDVSVRTRLPVNQHTNMPKRVSFHIQTCPEECNRWFQNTQRLAPGHRHRSSMHFSHKASPCAPNVSTNKDQAGHKPARTTVPADLLTPSMTLVVGKGIECAP